MLRNPSAGQYQDIWLGDSIELCEKFKPGSVNCVITDPPFGVDNQSNMAVTVEGKANARKIANDESPEVAIKVFNSVMDVLLPKTADNSDLYVFTAHQVLKDWLQVADDLGRHGFARCATLVWVKDGPGMGDLDGTWGQGYEFILYLKKNRRLRSSGVPRRSGILTFPQVRPANLIHPHEKPVPLLTEFIRWSTNVNDWIVDPFGGSGSTVRAAKVNRRNAIGIELDPENRSRALKKLMSSESELF